MCSPMVHSPLTKLQCCPTSDGSAAAILVSQEYLVNNPHLIETVNLLLDTGQYVLLKQEFLRQKTVDLLVGKDMTHDHFSHPLLPATFILVSDP